MRFEITFPDTLRIRLLESAPSNLAVLENINHTLNKIMANLADLQAAVAAEDTVIDSAVALIKGLADQVAALKPDQAAIDALAADINAKSQALADSVAAGTPVGPVSEPPAA